MPENGRQSKFEITTDRARLDVGTIHAFLTASYWASGIDIETVRRSIEHSLPFGVLHNGTDLVAFGRVITDFATFAYIADIFVLEQYRGQGLGKMIVEAMLAHPRLQGLRSWGLKTQDAHGLYEKFGFDRLAGPRTYMQRPGTLPPDYRRSKE